MKDRSPAQDFLNHLVGAFQRAIRLTNDFAIAYEPGPASTLLAGVASRYSDVTFYLVHVHREPPARTAPSARAFARRVGAHLLERLLSDREWEGVKAAPPLAGIPTPGLETAATLLMQAREAALVTPRLLLPLGSTALFASPPEPSMGFEDAMDAIGKASRTQLRVPYRDHGMVRLGARLLEADPGLAHPAGQARLFSQALDLLDLSTLDSQPKPTPQAS